MFNVNDRVKLTNEQGVPHYCPGAICTVQSVSPQQNWVGILADTDKEDGGIEVFPSSIVHVTNVPTMRPQPPMIDEMLKKSNPLVRTFSTGATRDTDENKLDFEGFLSPLVLEEFAKYMHGKRKMPDGSMRDSDNWQKGIPLDAYMKSMWRHFFAVWKSHRAGIVSQEDLMGLMFNVQGFIHETLKAGK